MESRFHRARLEREYGLQVVIPVEAERERLHRIIYDELCQGPIRDDSRQACLQLMRRMVAEDGVEGFVLGCAEIPLLVGTGDARWSLFDATRLHAECAVDAALADARPLAS